MFEGRLSQLSISESPQRKENIRYFRKRKHSVKKKILKSSIHIPSTKSNTSVHIHTSASKKSLKLKNNLNVRTESA